MKVSDLQKALEGVNPDLEIRVEGHGVDWARVGALTPGGAEWFVIHPRNDPTLPSTPLPPPSSIYPDAPLHLTPRTGFFSTHKPFSRIEKWAFFIMVLCVIDAIVALLIR